jgi:hypothetical protein
MTGGNKPEFSRTDGGEAGLHPSNIHDVVYAVGTVNMSGDLPVILGVDGPSLGGFVCPGAFQCKCISSFLANLISSKSRLSTPISGRWDSSARGTR